MSDGDTPKLDRNDEHHDPSGYDKAETWGYIRTFVGVFLLIGIFFLFLSVYENGFSVAFVTGLLFIAVIGAAVATIYESSLEKHKQNVKRNKELDEKKIAEKIMEGQRDIHENLSKNGARIVVNNVTFTFGNGCSYQGALAVGENINIAYNAAVDTKDVLLKQELERITELITKLTAQLAPESHYELSAHLKSFVEQAKIERPVRSLVEAPARGLIAAAKAVADFVTPVADAVNAVMKIIGFL